MVEPQSSRFWLAAQQSGLVEAGPLRACWDAIPEDKRSADAIDRRLARQAVDAGLLSLWQAQQLLAGRTGGYKIDKYVLVDRIGQGGMGRVYLAKDTRLNRQVALKILAPERMNNPRAITRFQREAKLGAQLQHENLVRIYDDGDSGGIRYLVMEYIQGRTVGQATVDAGRLAPEVAADIGRQVALGLEHAWQKGMIHRDVNPWNILLTDEGQAKLTDMGLAIDPTDAGDNVTRDGATVGTFDFIAPEQARHSRAVDTRADIYALGCTLYYMLAGRVPFPTPSLPEKLYAHQLAEPEPLGSLAPDLPPGLEDIIRRMMKKDPGERYHRPIDVARALETFAAKGAPARVLQAVSSASAVAVTVTATPDEGSRPSASDWDMTMSAGLATPAVTAGRSTSPAALVLGSGSQFPELDLGPEPPLREDRVSGVRSKSTSDVKPPRRLGLGLAVAAGVLAIIAVAALPWWRSSPPKSGGNGVAEGPKASRVSVQIGREMAPVAGLSQGIARLKGRNGVVLIGPGDGPLAVRDRLNVTNKTALRSQSAGEPQTIQFALDGPDSAIWVPAGVTLTLEGLRIVADCGSSPHDPPVSLFEIAGQLVLKNCEIIARGRASGVRAIDFKGRSLDADGCIFEGFDRAVVEFETLPGHQATLRHCLIVPGKSGQRAKGWAIRPTPASTALSDTNLPRLVLDRCTVLGVGLLAVDDTLSPALEVRATGNLFRTERLLSIPQAAFPASLRWAGSKNLFAVTGSVWSVQPPGGFDGLAGGLDLDEWRRTFGDVEADTKVHAVSLPADTVPADRPVSPVDYVPEDDDANFGIDPDRVGPEQLKAADRKRARAAATEEKP